MAIHNNMQYVHELVLTRSNYEYIIHNFHEYSHYDSYSTKNYLL
jgi:hypothetical protein